MSRHKRAAEDELSEQSDSTVASSPPHSSSQVGSEGRKRRRISDNSETTPEHENADGTQADSTVHGDSDVDSDTAEQQATQDLRQRKARGRDNGNVAKEAGVLEMVILHDFMCHHFFEYKLGPLINFVCGKNGSGKSAILTAIMLCLGGKASATNRGASLKRFIKEGTERARIICKLANKGEDAYMHEEYGDTITIERHFSRHGTSGYKIMTQSGRIVSTKRSDLESIVDHFGLQIDNPLNVLSQDMARSFIGSSQPGEKYKFFIKGVQLERLDQDYRLLGERIEEMKPKLRQKAEDVSSLKQTVREKKKKLELARKQDGLNDQIRHLKRQMFWARVGEHEEYIAEYDGEIATADTKIAENRAVVDDLDSQFQQADAAVQSISATRDTANAAFQTAEDDQRQHKNTFDEAKAEANRAKTEQRGIGESIKQATQAIKAQERLINEEERRLADANGGGATRRLQELEVARSGARQAKDDYEGHKNGKARIDADIQSAKLRVHDQTTDRETRKNNVREQREKLRDLQESGHRQTSAFRQNTDKLERAIANETRFQQKPIGPLGRHVKLLRPEWSSIIESMFGRTLSDFLVFSKRDSDLLNQLKQRVNCDAGVAIINKSPIVPREPDEGFDTIMRVLNIDDEYVAKFLIIQHAIEQHLLIPDLHAATVAMYEHGRLRSVKGCFAFNPYDKSKGALLKYTASGDPSQDPVRGWMGPPRMKSDLEATLSSKRALLEEAEKNAASAETAWNQARLESGKLEAAQNRHTKRERELKAALDAAEDKVGEVQEAIQEDQVESGKLDALKEGMAEVEENKRLVEEQFKDAVTATDVKTKVMRDTHAQLTQYDNQVAELQAQRDQAQQDHRQADSRKQQTLYVKNNADARVRDAEQERERIISVRDHAKEELAQFEQEAREKTNSERVAIDEGDTGKAIQDRVIKLAAQRDRARRHLGFTLQEAVEEASKAEQAYSQARKDYDDLEEVKIMLATSLEERQAKWYKFRRHITARAKSQFVYLLSERGFRGNILMSHKKHLMELSVEPDLSRRSGQGRNTKTLSGGEKSFSQICLLLAIWEAMGSPIRCLDEFDVFMDAVNRNLSVKMIIAAARESIGKQFILISPGSKNDIDRASDVVVQDLGAPERGGNDGQRTIEETGGLR